MKKVYELMEELSQAPAGADVVISGWFTDSELNDATEAVQITDNGEALKCLSFNECDAEVADDTFHIYIE